MKCSLIKLVGTEGDSELYYSLTLGEEDSELGMKTIELPLKKLFCKETIALVSEYEKIFNFSKAKELLQQELIHIKEQKDVEVKFKQIGWNRRKNIPVFVFSNCYVTKNSIESGNYTLVEGMELEVSEDFGDDIAQKKIRIMELIKIFSAKPEIFYPIFLTNIAALLNGCLGKMGKAPALVMWLGGKPGSGKTELATWIGSFVNKSVSDKAKARKNLMTAFVKPGDLIESLIKHRDINFILDDVKNEKAQSQKERTRICVDVCIRSVKEQKVLAVYRKEQEKFLNSPIESGAIITGENMELFRSSIARIIYINVEGFMNDERATCALRQIQDSPYILTDVMVYLIQFLCGQFDNEEYWKKLSQEQDEVREKMKKLFYGSNKTRFADTIARMETALTVLQDFMMSCGMKMEMTVISSEIIKAVKCTSLLIQEKEDILMEAFEKVMTEMPIQMERTVYDEYDDSLEVEPYILYQDQEGICIRNLEVFEQQKKGTSGPVIICREECLKSRLKEKMKELIEYYRYEGEYSLIVDNHRLRKAGIISGEKRYDNTYNCQFDYYYEKSVIGQVWVETTKCVCMNPENSIVKKKISELLNEYPEKKEYLRELDYIEQKRIMSIKEGNGRERAIRTGLLRSFDTIERYAGIKSR